MSFLRLIIRSIIVILLRKLFAVEKSVSQTYSFEENLLEGRYAAFKAMFTIKNKTKDLFHT